MAWKVLKDKAQFHFTLFVVLDCVIVYNSFFCFSCDLHVIYRNLWSYSTTLSPLLYIYVTVDLYWIDELVLNFSLCISSILVLAG